MHFGESIPGYDIRVLNERQVRAAAGLLFVFAFTAFLKALLVGEYALLKIFVVFFWFDFLVRVFIDTRYAPSLILGLLAVRTQKPEYAGAPQKRFAWMLGFGMATIMILLLFVLDIRGPINFALCVLCLTLLFLETAFGICVGCTLYNMIPGKQARLCPGGACELGRPPLRISPVQWGILVVVMCLLVAAFVLAL